MKNRITSILQWVLAGLVALIFISSGIFKLSGTAEAGEMAKGVGGNTNLIILAILEIIFAVLFLVPRTGILGSLLMIAYMGGAMAVHLVGSTSILVPTTIQVLIWLTVVLRFPELNRRLLKGKI